ncbi:hypothetical protein KKE78_01200 [Patescibacteria group bacterium]|nr:hypothetical protein [Patescibacteria group bacterium]
MKKILSISILVISLLVLPTIVSAQQQQQGQTKNQDNVQEVVTEDEETVIVPQGNQVQNQNQVKTQNQGEETQLQVTTQHMEQLMDMQGASEEVGNKVRTIAQEQVQTQTQIQTQLNKLKSKSGLMKKLFGPDYGAIKNLKQQKEQNQLRIQQLEQLQTQVINQADQTQLEEAVQALVDQNTTLQDQIETEEQAGSLFGWLIKLFVK